MEYDVLAYKEFRFEYSKKRKLKVLKGMKITQIQYELKP